MNILMHENTSECNKAENFDLLPVHQLDTAQNIHIQQKNTHIHHAKMTVKKSIIVKNL